MKVGVGRMDESETNLPIGMVTAEYVPSNARIDMKTTVYNTEISPSMDVNFKADRLRIRFKGKSTKIDMKHITDGRDERYCGREGS